MNSIIYVLNPNLEKVSVVNKYTAREWNTVWSSSGSFTLWAPITEENSTYLVENNLIWCGTRSLGVIEHIIKSTDEDTGKASIQISGRLCESNLLSRRIIWGLLTKSGFTSEVIAEILNSQVINPTNPKRKLSSIHMETPLSTLGEHISFINSYGNVWEQIEQLCLVANLDLRLIYDEETRFLNCSLKQGRDLSDIVKLSTDLGILFDSDYEKDISDYCNSVLVAGEGEGSERTITTLGDELEGLSRKELYVDARDLQSTNSSGFSIPQEEYIASLKERGRQKLTEHPVYESYEATLGVKASDSYKYGEDYSLGDIITLEDTSLQVKVQAIVREETISEDENGASINLTFGLALPTITKLIKRRD